MEAGQVEETVFAQLEADIARGREQFALAVVILAASDLEAAAFAVILEDHVDGAGDRVGAVDGGGAILQHFDAGYGIWRNEVDAGCGRTLERTGDHLKNGRAMATLAVHHHQRVVGAQATQTGRQREVRHVGALGLGGEAWHHLGQGLVEVRLADMAQRFLAEDLNRCGAFRGLHAGCAGAGNDDGCTFIGLRLLRCFLRHGAGRPG